MTALPPLTPRYRAIRLLGEGGVAQVWLALDRQRRQQVAIKILRAQYAEDEGILRRFHREAALIIQLDSPHIVTVYELDESTPTPFIVMEYVAGVDLRTVLHLDAPLEVDRALRWVRDIAAGIAVAHNTGLIHRDLKPANILITPDGSPKITDFGIAYEVAGARLTEPSNVWGTSHYLAPEQGLGQPLTPATDVYSLGVLLFEMLTGTLPFPGDDPIQVTLAHIQQPAPSVNRYQPTIPAGVAELVARMLAKEPAVRPADGATLQRILGRYVDGANDATIVHDGEFPLATVASRTRPRPITSRRFPRNVGIAIVLAVLVVAIGAGGIAAWNAAAFEDAPPVVPLVVAATATASPTPTRTPRPSATPTRTPTPAPTARSNNGEDAIAVEVNSPILPDGDLADWRAFPTVAIDQITRGRERWSGQSDLSGSVAFAWDADNLYLSVERRDDTHLQTTSGENLYQGDVVELWLDTDVQGDYTVAEANGDDFQIVLSAGDFGSRRAEGYIMYPLPRDDTRSRAIRIRALPLPNGYTLEAAIPWSLLDVRPRADFTLGYAVVLSDIDTPTTLESQTQLTTTPRPPFLNPSTFGNLLLTNN